jgi:hypothetical protein
MGNAHPIIAGTRLRAQGKEFRIQESGARRKEHNTKESER